MPCCGWGHGRRRMSRPPAVRVSGGVPPIHRTGPRAGSGQAASAGAPPRTRVRRWVRRSLHWSRSGCWRRSRYRSRSRHRSRSRSWSRSRRKSRFRRSRWGRGRNWRGRGRSWRGRGQAPGGPRKAGAEGRGGAERRRTEPGMGRTSQRRAGTAVRLRTGPRRTTTIQPAGTLWVRCPPGAGWPGTAPGGCPARLPRRRQPRRGGPVGSRAARGRARGMADAHRRAGPRWRFPASYAGGRLGAAAGPAGRRLARRACVVGGAGRQVAAAARPVGRRRRPASAGPAPPRWAALQPARRCRAAASASTSWPSPVARTRAEGSSVAPVAPPAA